MMSIEEAERRLVLFGMPSEGEGADEVRKILARLLAGGALALSDLQIARDIVEHLGDSTPGLYLFLSAMRLSLRAGNTFLRLGKGPDLLKAAGRLDDAGDDQQDKLVDACWAEYAQSAGGTLAKNDGQLVVCKDVGGNEKGWFFARVWDSVNAVAKQLKGLSEEGDLVPFSEDAVGRAVRFMGKGGPFSLNPEQQNAVRAVGKRRLAVVTGGPGTGKTTVVCAILRALMERGDIVGEDIALVAPTGRAAQRMGESIHAQCEAAVGIGAAVKDQIAELAGATIHTTLGGLPPDWKYNHGNRLPYKLVIVDESSMVDVHLMQALLEALPEKCRLVLLGDKDQLPSVDAGAVLGDIVAKYGERTVVELVTSNRFTGVLADCARAVNAGDKVRFEESVKDLPVGEELWTATISSDDADNVNRVFRYKLPESVKPATSNRLLLEWARNYGLLHMPADGSRGMKQIDGALVKAARSVAKDNLVFVDGSKTAEVEALFKQLNRSRVLTVVREGPFGAKGINDLIITERFHGRRPADPLVAEGVPVMITRNTREQNLWNGDIGVTVKGPNGMTVLFPRGDKVAPCPVALLPDHDLAYAMTVHKSQGSEFENVLVVLPDAVKHPLLNRQIVYTGITRAKKRAVILGTEKALGTALERRLERDSGID